MEAPGPGFEFEEPIYELQCRLREYEEQPQKTPETEDAIRKTRREIAQLTARIYANLTPWQTVQVARHKDRPHTVDYISLAFDEFVELHGDKHFGDDYAIRTGFAKLDQHKVMVVGHEKGRTYKEKSACNFGCAHPEGYRKAIAKMRTAAKFGLPIICLIDTPGAYPGIGAEECGQAQVIAENMYEMSRLGTPIICIVIGEGGSGGALGIGVGDRIAILQNAYYSVISPEGCAGIIWKSHEFASKAADALKFTSSHLKELGIVDDVIAEPLGGAHRDPHRMASHVKMYLMKTLHELRSISVDELLLQRYEKFRRMGVFYEDATAAGDLS
jgi:acetyl-CoA carboxylase carboxyl transferase subunit alpha